MQSRNIQMILDHANPHQIETEYAMVNELLLAGYTVVDEKNLPMLSQLRTNMKKLEQQYNPSALNN